MDQRCHQHHRGDHRDDRDRRQRSAAPERVTERPRRDEGGVLAVRARHAERRGHLLQEDDRRDPEREPLDHGPRYEREVAAEARDPGREDHDAGEHSHEEHGLDAEAGDDGHQDDGHRAGRPGHLDVGAAEDGRDHPGDDGRDESGRGAQATRHAEGQCEGKGHHADGDAGDDVLAPAAAHPGIVRAPGQHRPGPGQGREGHPFTSPSPANLTGRIARVRATGRDAPRAMRSATVAPPRAGRRGADP